MATISRLIDTVKSFISSKYLSLSGGTMTGAIHFTGGDSIYRTDNDTGLTIYGGTDSNSGAYFQAFGKNSTYNSGVFNIVTSNGSNKIALRGAPNGDLTWNARNVVVVESWHSGTTWYRKYADGFIEQGGLLIPSSGDNNYLEVTVTLPIAFSNTNYIALSTGTYTTHLGSSDAVVTKKTTTQVGIKAHIYKAGVEYATFYCCGR